MPNTTQVGLAIVSYHDIAIGQQDQLLTFATGLHTVSVHGCRCHKVGRRDAESGVRAQKFERQAHSLNKHLTKPAEEAHSYVLLQIRRRQTHLRKYRSFISSS